MTAPLTAENFANPLLPLDEVVRAHAVLTQIPGYSDPRHYAFFRTALAALPIRRVLMLGVYFGRDIALLLEAAHRLGRFLEITGVDKFSDDACADWPATLLGASWEQAGFGTAPTLEATAGILGPLAAPSHVKLVRARDEAFLAQCRDRFDLIYLDTAHDEATVLRQLRQARPLLAEGGIFAGDDYADSEHWGVVSALRKAAPGHLLAYDYIWVATEAHLRAADPTALAA